MARVAPRVPELAEILCSQCGYVLSGLPETGNCPECGRPIADSLGGDRFPPSWESASPDAKAQAFLRTTIEIIRRPAHFYRTFTVRGPLNPAKRFARWHWVIASILFGICGATHGTYDFSFAIRTQLDFPGGETGKFFTLLVGVTLGSYLFLDGITRLAARLTTLEATYRGYRLPYDIVHRGLCYHAAHYLPVAVAALVVVEGYLLMTWVNRSQFIHYHLPDNSAIIYLYVLSAVVVLSAIYLFQTYWIGMRNMMYANR